MRYDQHDWLEILRQDPGQKLTDMASVGRHSRIPYCITLGSRINLMTVSGTERTLRMSVITRLKRDHETQNVITRLKPLILPLTTLFPLGSLSPIYLPCLPV